MGKNNKVIAGDLGQHHARREHRFQLFDQRQQQHFPLALLQHSGGILQGFAGHHHQGRGLLAGHRLLQQPHQECLVGQIRYREAGGVAVHLFMLAQNTLLVDVIAAHQLADFVVVMQARQRKLMAKLLLRRQLIQLPGQAAQRVNNQPVDAPGERHGQHQGKK